MSANILDAVIKLAAIKQLDKDLIQSIILDSLSSTLSKKLEPENNLQISIDDASGMIKVSFLSKVVEEGNDLGEISIADARREYDSKAQLDQYIHRVMSLHDFEPKLVKTAQKNIMDRIKKLEEDKITNDFNRQKYTIVTGKLKAIEDNGGYKVDIGYTDALLPVDEQIENEYYKVGDTIRAYVVSIRANQSKVTIILSRSNPEFVKKLFEAEIPEIFQGSIKIRKIVREPGIRTKVELESSDSRIDPVSVCIGVKGTRIDSIRKELHGEQIDIVVHSEDQEDMIRNALGVENIKRVIIERAKAAAVIVSNQDKVTAIGKQGKNVKLAAKMTGLKIDIYTEDEFEEKMAKERRTISHITELDGVTPKIAEILRKTGYTSVQDIYGASVDELCNLEGIGQKIAERLKEAAKFF